MTIAAGFRCMDGVVLCADTQETIPEYLKIHGPKILLLQQRDKLRLALTGAGGANMIDMVFHTIMRRVPGDGSVQAMQEIVAEVVYETCMKHVMPFPRDERPWFQLIGAIQVKGEPAALFKSVETTVAPVDHFACVGSVAFAHYAIGDLEIRTLPLCVVRTLAIYMLDLVKEYDPDCGKRSEVNCLYDDWTDEVPSPRYIRVVESELRMIQALTRQLILQSMAHREAKAGIVETWEHLKKHIDIFQKLERKRTDKHCRLKPEWLFPTAIIHVQIKAAKKTAEKK